MIDAAAKSAFFYFFLLLKERPERTGRTQRMFNLTHFGRSKEKKMEGDWTQTAWFLVGLVTLRQPAGFKEARSLFFFSVANKLWGIFERVKKFRPLTA